MWTRFGAFDGAAGTRRAELLRFCSEALALAPARLSLAHDALGAPLLLVDGAQGEWRVSSASRGKIYLFGLSRVKKIGVDVEILDAAEPAWNVLCPDERAMLAALPQARHGEVFLQLWTAKEAYCKALGLGLRREPSEICVAPANGGFRIFDRGREVFPAQAQLWRERLGTRVALCASVLLSAGGEG